MLPFLDPLSHREGKKVSPASLPLLELRIKSFLPPSPPSSHRPTVPLHPPSWESGGFSEVFGRRRGGRDCCERERPLELVLHRSVMGDVPRLELTKEFSATVTNTMISVALYLIPPTPDEAAGE